MGGICRADLLVVRDERRERMKDERVWNSVLVRRYGRQTLCLVAERYYASQQRVYWDCVWLVAACTLAANFFRRIGNADAERQLHDRLRDPSFGNSDAERQLHDRLRDPSFSGDKAN